MKVLRQSTRCIRGNNSVKKFGFGLLFLVLVVVYYQNSVISVLCDESVYSYSDSKISEEEIEKLKKKWLAEHEGDGRNVIGDAPPDSNLKPESISSVECLINDDYTVQCLQSNDEPKTVYMPFSFIEKYFDVTGKVKHYDGYHRFEFSQSYTKV